MNWTATWARNAGAQIDYYVKVMRNPADRIVAGSFEKVKAYAASVQYHLSASSEVRSFRTMIPLIYPVLIH